MDPESGLVLNANILDTEVEEREKEEKDVKEKENEAKENEEGAKTVHLKLNQSLITKYFDRTLQKI